MDMHGVKVVEYAYGTKRWFKNAKPHREDGPAIELADGDKYWCRDGEYHREDGPAIELANGDKYWYINGRELTEQEFEERLYEEASYFDERELAENGRFMAVRLDKGDFLRAKFAFSGRDLSIQSALVKAINKQLIEWGEFPVADIGTSWHGVEVIEYEDGTKRWFKNAKPHREDGPAVELANGDKYWYINGEKGRYPGPAVELANGDKYWFKNGRELTEREVEAARHAEAWYLREREREESD